MTNPYAVDTLLPVTPPLLTDCLHEFDKYIGQGQKPVAWFRYTCGDGAHLSRAEIDLLTASDIRCFPVSRLSNAVCRDEKVGAFLAQQEVERIGRLTDKLGVFSWLDVEQKPILSPDFWLGWSQVIAGNGHVPCLYMPNRKYWAPSWDNLRKALARGATCGGTWPAWYVKVVDGSAHFAPVPWNAEKAAGIDEVDVQLWQCVGNACQKKFDLSVLNPSISLDWLENSL